MTRMPDFEADIRRGHPSRQSQREEPMSAVRQLHDIATQLSGNPLITAITAHPGMGQRLTEQDVDTVMRVIASIEAARIEVPHGYRPERPGDVARDLAQDGLLSPDTAERILGQDGS